MNKIFNYTAFLFVLILCSCHDPKMTITSPMPGITVESESIEIKGEISPKDADLLANGELVIVDGEGNFSYNAKLKDSINTIQFEAVINDHVLQEQIIIRRRLAITELELLKQEKLKKETDLRNRQEKIGKILSNQSIESVKEKYQKIIDGCYGYTTYRKKGGTLSERTFNMTKFNEIMKKKGFHIGKHPGDFYGTDDLYKVNIIHASSPNSDGWNQNWDIQVEIDESKI